MYVTINLACFHSIDYDRNHTIDSLVDYLKPESDRVLEKFTETQLKKHIKSKTKSFKFSQQLITELNVRPIRLKSFQDSVKIVKS